VAVTVLFWLVSFALHPVTWFRHRARYKRYLDQEARREAAG
jgi:hypothetical protein